MTADHAPEGLSDEERTMARDLLCHAIESAVNFHSFDAGLEMSDFDIAAALVDTEIAASAPGGVMAAFDTAVERILTARTAALSEEVARVEALADEWAALVDKSQEVKPYTAGDTVGRYCGKAGRAVVTTVNPLNWNTPDHLAAYCETRGCSCSMDVTTLPKRYVVSRSELEAGAYRLLYRLRGALHPDTSPTQPSSGAEEGLL